MVRPSEYDSYFKKPVRLDNIRTDYPSNQLFYSINRIPRTEENYDPGTWVMTLHLNDFKGFKTFHLIKVPFIVLIYHFRAWNICSDCKQLFSKPIFKSKIWTRSDSTSCCWYWWNRQRSKNWSWQIEKRNRGSLKTRIFPDSKLWGPNCLGPDIFLWPPAKEFQNYPACQTSKWQLQVDRMLDQVPFLVVKYLVYSLESSLPSWSLILLIRSAIFRLYRSLNYDLRNMIWVTIFRNYQVDQQWRWIHTCRIHMMLRVEMVGLRKSKFQQFKAKFQ